MFWNVGYAFICDICVDAYIGKLLEYWFPLGLLSRDVLSYWYNDRHYQNEIGVLICMVNSFENVSLDYKRGQTHINNVFNLGILLYFVQKMSVIMYTMQGSL